MIKKKLLQLYNKYLNIWVKRLRMMYALEIDFWRLTTYMIRILLSKLFILFDTCNLFGIKHSPTWRGLGCEPTKFIYCFSLFKWWVHIILYTNFCKLFVCNIFYTKKLYLSFSILKTHSQTLIPNTPLV